MKRLVTTILAASTLGFASLAFATGIYTCESGDRSGWKSIDELERKMIDEGWKVRRIKEDGGCYEAYGTTPEGQRVEAYFHLVTLEKMLVARRGEILFEKGN